MRREIFASLFAIALLCASAVAQPFANANWVGIWHAEVDGKPSSTLTLGNDTGELGGTVVLDMVSREGGAPHVIASEPHVLMNLHADSNTLSFQVRIQRPDGVSLVASFIVARTPSGKATIHCTTCGPDAPVVELVKESGQEETR